MRFLLIALIKSAQRLMLLFTGFLFLLDFSDIRQPHRTERHEFIFPLNKVVVDLIIPGWFLHSLLFLLLVKR